MPDNTVKNAADEYAMRVRNDMSEHKPLLLAFLAGAEFQRERYETVLKGHLKSAYGDIGMAARMLQELSGEDSAP